MDHQELRKNWLETESPAVILVSVHSAFHKEIDGDLKMNAFISTIKSHVKGKITVLLSDRAHVQAMSLNYQNNLEIGACSAIPAGTQKEQDEQDRQDKILQ